MELSLFQPYESKAPHHEDHLTWAFLNVLRLVPMALATFVDMVAAQHRENPGSDGETLPSLAQLPYQALGLYTQVSAIPQRTGKLLSIVMTDEHWAQTAPVQASDRRARFDGLLCFEPSWILVIENKPRAVDIWEAQLSPPLPDGSEIELSQTAICLVWRDVVQALGGLVQRGLCQGAEAQLIEDFLAFTDRRFPYLNPYPTLGRCKGNDYLLKRRCAAILGSLGLGDAERDRGYENYVRLPAGAAERLYLFPDGTGHLRLELYPGDTVAQARDVLGPLDAEAFLGLAEQGWDIVPNLHFAVMGTHLQWSTTSMPAGDYLAYWRAHPDRYGRVAKADLPGRVAGFVADGLMTPADAEAIDKAFLQTKRANANVIPGLRVAYRLPLANAVALDEEGQLGTVVAGLAAKALATWGQALVPADGAVALEPA